MKHVTTKNLIISGLLIALSILLTRIFSQQVPIAGVPASRLSAGSVPIILAGIVAGPVYGMAVGALADAVGFVMFPSGIYFPPITLTSAMVGLIPGLIVRYSGKMADWLKTLISIAAVQVVCSMLLQTWFLSILMGKGFEVLFLPRAVVALVMIPIFYLLIYPVLLGLKRARLVPQRLSTK